MLNSHGFHRPVDPRAGRVRRRILASADAPRRAILQFRPRLVLLEQRTLLSVFLVDTTADSGPGSLRQAILDSDAGSGGTIEFSLPGQGVRTIVPATPLPAITGDVLIDGTSQPDYDGTPLIRVSEGPPGAAGLSIAGPDVTVRGLAVDLFGIVTTADVQLIAQVQPAGLATQLSLLDAQGQVLVQSDGLSPTDPDDLIDEHLQAGTDLLQVGSTGGAGDYTLTTTLTLASLPGQPLSIPSNSAYGAMAVGDFNGNGIPDLAAPDGVHLGLGDGTFEPPPASGLGLSPLPPNESITAMVAGDFTGNGRLDLAVAHSSNLSYPGGTDPGGVYILLGNGDGTFQPPTEYRVGDNPVALAVGDFTDNGRLDLAVADAGN